MQLVGLMQQECVGGLHRGGDLSFFRAAAYAVAVLCGHAHHARDAQVHMLFPITFNTKWS